ncbi:MAG: YvcK family protein [bacterium]|nr:YvcK family protein [bacterium]
MKRIVTIGGGTGQFGLLSGLKAIPDIDITAVVTMADSGGSSGVLRTERGALPPGDVLRCLLALATADDDVVQLFQYRLADGGGVGGHTLGNLVLTGAAERKESFLGGIETVAKLLQPRGRVLPVTTDRVQLRARLEDGTVLQNEHDIDCPTDEARSRIVEVWLEPEAEPFPDVLDAFRSADAVVVGPGDLFTSIIPNVLVREVPDALRETPGQLVFVVNAMTKRGETDEYSARDFVLAFERYVGRAVNVVVCNTQAPDPDVLARYQREGANVVDAIVGNHTPVTSDCRWEDRRIVPFPLLADGPFARHDPMKLAHVIRALL